MFLPYLEQQPLYNSINLLASGFLDSSANDTAALTSVACFLCPTDVGDPPNGTNYVGNLGIILQTYVHNGTISPKRVGFESLTDGASQTAAFAEIVLGARGSRDARRVVYSTPHNLYRAEDFDKFIEECRELNTSNSTIVYDRRGYGWLECDYAFTLYNHANPINSHNCAVNGSLQKCAWLAGSLHPGGGNVVCSDGHVKFVKSSVDLVLWRALGSRAGGEIVSFE